MSTNSMTTLNAWFKTSYSDRVSELLPDSVYYAKEIPDISSEQRPGGTYTQPVNLTSEQGITKASASAGAFALNSPIAMSTGNATINGSQFLLRTGLDYETIFRSQNKNSFIRATKGVVKNMLKSAYFYMEADLMWGTDGVGILSAAGATTITLTAASWASGLWLGAENRRIRIESAAGVLRGVASVTSYVMETRVITLDAVPAGCIATDIVRWEADGASSANCMSGIYNILTPAAGAFMGINDSTYSLWAPATAYGAGAAPLSFNKIMLAISGAVNKGLGDDINEIDVVVSPGAWQNLGNDLAALRTIDSSWKSTDAGNGSEAISFFCQAGKVRVITHRLMKEGFAFIHPKASRFFERVGCQSTPTFKLPGMVSAGDEQYLLTMQNNAGIELRNYWNTSVFTDKRCQGRIISGIVNATV